MLPDDISRLVLRAAKPDDVEAIATVWHDAWRDGHLGHVDRLSHAAADVEN